MQINLDAAHMGIEIITMLVGAAATGIALRIRLSQAENQISNERRTAEVKADLIESQTQAKEEITEKYAKISMELAAHLSKDEQQFVAVNKTLDRIEKKIDNGNGVH